MHGLRWVTDPTGTQGVMKVRKFVRGESNPSVFAMTGTSDQPCWLALLLGVILDIIV